MENSCLLEYSYKPYFYTSFFIQIQGADLYLTLFAASMFSIIIVCLFLLIVFLNYKRNVKRHKEALLLIFETQEQERIRIANDLHDHFGAIFSSVKANSRVIMAKIENN